MTADPFTMALRLCDEHGIVSRAPIPGAAPGGDCCYLDRVNRLIGPDSSAREGQPEGIAAPFRCTGAAHLAGEHILCTSPAHQPPNEASTAPTSFTRPVGGSPAAEMMTSAPQDAQEPLCAQGALELADWYARYALDRIGSDGRRYDPRVGLHLVAALPNLAAAATAARPQMDQIPPDEKTGLR